MSWLIVRPGSGQTDGDQRLPAGVKFLLYSSYGLVIDPPTVSTLQVELDIRNRKVELAERGVCQVAADLPILDDKSGSVSRFEHTERTSSSAGGHVSAPLRGRKVLSEDVAESQFCDLVRPLPHRLVGFVSEEPQVTRCELNVFNFGSRSDRDRRSEVDAGTEGEGAAISTQEVRAQSPTFQHRAKVAATVIDPGHTDVAGGHAGEMGNDDLHSEMDRRQIPTS